MTHTDAHQVGFHDCCLLWLGKTKVQKQNKTFFHFQEKCLITGNSFLTEIAAVHHGNSAVSWIVYMDC